MHLVIVQHLGLSNTIAMGRPQKNTTNSKNKKTKKNTTNKTNTFIRFLQKLFFLKYFNEKQKKRSHPRMCNRTR